MEVDDEYLRRVEALEAQMRDSLSSRICKGA